MKLKSVKHLFFAVLTASALVVPSTGLAAQIALEASVDSPEVGKGETFSYRLKVIEEGQVDLAGNIVPPDLTGFKVTGQFSSTSTKAINNQARTVTDIEYRMSSDIPGERTIGPAKIVLTDPKTGKNTEITSNPVKVTVLAQGRGAIKSLQEDIRDIKGPKTFFEKVRMFFYLMAAIVALVLILLVALAVYMTKRSKAKRQQIPEAKAVGSLSARDAAYAALVKAEALRADPKAFYTAVVGAVRQFLKDAYGIPAVEMTTTEIMAEVKKSAVPAPAWDRLWAILGEADMVKFAKHLPSEDEKTAFVEKARELLKLI
jgi:hypothetical protein